MTTYAERFSFTMKHTKNRRADVLFPDLCSSTYVKRCEQLISSNSMWASGHFYIIKWVKSEMYNLHQVSNNNIPETKSVKNSLIHMVVNSHVYKHTTEDQNTKSKCTIHRILVGS